tara:strand:+ start:840 stop:1334 length:495 start_codon:yes stop_codon:yes gene_type:complete
MENASYIGSDIIDQNYLKYTGWSESNLCVQQYFSKDTVRTISRKVSELTMGVDPENRTIVVPDNRIIEVMNSVWSGYRPPTGDIYSRYIVPSGDEMSDNQRMIDQCIEIIVSFARNTIGIEENNKKLTAWTTVYGDFNEHQLRQHPPIKIRNKRPNPLEFNMNY